MNRKALFTVCLVAASICSGWGAQKQTQNEFRGDESGRVYLNQGYAQLYTALSSFRWTDDIFLIKFESDRVKAVGDDLASTASKLRDRLSQLAKTGPDLSLDDDGLPPVAKDNQAAARKARLKSFAPLVGRSGANFERTLLLSNSGGLNQTRHLCDVLLEREKRADMRSFLSEVRQELNRLYARVLVVLNEDYFIHNTYTPPEEYSGYVTREKTAAEKKAGSTIDR